MSQEVRLAVERALSKLINRFGNEGDVVRELRYALKLMERDSASSGVPTPPPEEPEPSRELAASDSSESEPEAEPRPRARKSMGRKK